MAGQSSPPPVPDGARRRLLKAAGSALAIAAGIARAAPPPPAASDAARAGAIDPRAGTLDDRMPAFWQVYDATRERPDAERARRLVEGFFVPEEALYRRAGMRAPTVESIATWLARFDGMAAAVRAVHGHLHDDLRVNSERFRAALPDFDAGASPVFAMPSLFRFDAHLQADGATMPLFFGPDGIVRYHGAGADLRVLFAHEIFHCYQAQRSPAMSLDPRAPLYANLWIEGVATWASQQLNPEASLLHVLLDDEALLRHGPATAPRVAAAMLERIDTTDDATIASLFGTGTQPADWPERAGYYVGWLAARRIGRDLSMREMAGLPAPQVRERLVAALREIRAAPVDAASGAAG